MQRRTLLKVGLAGAVTLGLAAGGVALWTRRTVRPGLPKDHREVMRAIARAVLDGSLPTDAALAAPMIEAHLDRLEAAVLAFPAHVQDELRQLLDLLATAPGRRLLAGLRTPWHEASVDEVQASLASMRMSRLALRQQAYHALRDLTNAAFYSEPGTWAMLGYPGPRPI